MRIQCCCEYLQCILYSPLMFCEMFSPFVCGVSIWTCFVLLWCVELSGPGVYTLQVRCYFQNPFSCSGNIIISGFHRAIIKHWLVFSLLGKLQHMNVTLTETWSGVYVGPARVRLKQHLKLWIQRVYGSILRQRAPLVLSLKTRAL